MFSLTKQYKPLLIMSCQFQHWQNAVHFTDQYTPCSVIHTLVPQIWPFFYRIHKFGHKKAKLMVKNTFYQYVINSVNDFLVYDFKHL
jgi:hypothetical protein